MIQWKLLQILSLNLSCSFVFSHSVVDSLTTTRRVKRRSQTSMVDSLLSPQESPTRSVSTSGKRAEICQLGSPGASSTVSFHLEDFQLTEKCFFQTHRQKLRACAVLSRVHWTSEYQISLVFKCFRIQMFGIEMFTVQLVTIWKPNYCM
jgi:hypothetical protein